MLDAFFLRVLLSFVVAGIWITLATVLSEKFGTKIGGAFGNLPSTLLVSIIFIAWTQDLLFVTETLKIIPLALMVDTIFLFVYIVAAKKIERGAPLIALIIWFLLALPIGFMMYDDIWIGSLLFVVVTVVAFYWLEYRMHIPSKAGRKKQYTLGELSMRGGFAGSVVASAVVIAAFGGPVWGGLASVFPAVMLSTMYLLTKAQGSGFAQATGKVMLPASMNLGVFALVAYHLYPVYGLVVGSIVAYLAAFVFALGIYPLMKRTV